VMKRNSARTGTRDLTTNLFVTLALAALFTLINPNFIDKYNLISIGQNLAPYALLSLGVMMPISMGGTDLSVGALCIGSAVVAGKLYSLGMPLWATIPVMLAFGTLIGLLNGFLIAKQKMAPFIVTLGSMMFVRGITAIFAGTASVLYPTGSWFNNLFSSYRGIPVSFVWILLSACVIYFIYRKTKLGRYWVSIGSSEKATRISGIDVDQYKMIAYAASGLMAGLAGVMWTASFATITVATGNGMELDAIAGVYIGGTSAAGGLANVFGSVLGSVMLVVIRSGLNFALAKLNIPINSTYVTYVISGIIVILAVRGEATGRVRGKKKCALFENPKTKRIALSVCSVLLCAFLVLTNLGVFFGEKEAETAAERKLCLLMKSEGPAYWDSVIAGAKAAGEKYGYEILCRGPEGEDSSYLPRQLELMGTLLAEEPAAMAIATIANGFTESLEKGYDLGIPMIQFDSGLYAEDAEAIKDSEKNPLLTWVKASNYSNSNLVAEHAFELLHDEIAQSDGYVVGAIQHEITVAAEARTSGFVDRFEELAESDPETAGKVTVITEIKPSQENNAYKQALEFLYEKDVDLVFMGSEFVVNQVADAVKASGGKYDGLKFVGFDAGEKQIEWMKEENSQLIGSVSQDPYNLGYLTVETMVKILDGEEVGEEITVPGLWYDKTNVDELR